MVTVKKFYAVWCSPCRTLNPIYNEVKSILSRKDVQFQEIDVDYTVGEVQQYKVQSVPTIIIIKDGFVVDRITGVISRDDLINRINKHLD